MADIFISYAREDKKRVKPLVQHLEGQGWSVFWDTKIPTGNSWDELIERELIAAKCVLVVWSKTSVEKRWVKIEARNALQRGILFPVRFENINPPLEFSDKQAADLTGWKDTRPHAGMDQLIQDLSNILAQGMVLIPKGSFLSGVERHREEVPYDYYIDISPVTNQDYARFMEAGGYRKKTYWSKEGWVWKKSEQIKSPGFWEDSKWNKPDHPVVGVGYYEAEAYAKWAGKRLPTVLEWDKAARGTDGRMYPWGDRFEPERCNKWPIESTTPVTKYPKGVSFYGCYDMVGNAAEWCASWDSGFGNMVVVRGGPSLGDDGVVMRLAITSRNLTHPYDYVIGFRLAQDIP